MCNSKRSLPTQISELQAEVAYRESGLRHHPLRVGYLKPEATKYGIDNLNATIKSLEWLQLNERLIRQRCPELFGGRS